MGTPAPPLSAPREHQLQNWWHLVTNEGTRPFAESSLEAQLITGQPDPPDHPGSVSQRSQEALAVERAFR